MTPITFVVRGTPVPQGSLKAIRAGRRIALISDNSKLAAWRRSVTAAAKEAGAVDKNARASVGPVVVAVEFAMPRPKSRRDPLPATRPDLDKLVRAVLDGITDSELWGDDGQVVSITASKRWADEDGPGCVITIAEAA